MNGVTPYHVFLSFMQGKEKKGQSASSVVENIPVPICFSVIHDVELLHSKVGVLVMHK